MILIAGFGDHIILFFSMFGLLLFLYELAKYARVCIPDESLDSFDEMADYFLLNFGFLYGPVPRSIFLVFIALLQFGLRANPGSSTNNNYLGGKKIKPLIIQAKYLFLTDIFVLNLRISHGRSADTRRLSFSYPPYLLRRQGSRDFAETSEKRWW